MWDLLSKQHSGCCHVDYKTVSAQLKSEKGWVGGGVGRSASRDVE